MRGYGPEVRRRVIRAVEDGSSARAAAARFDVGVATAIRWARRWREEATLGDPPRQARGSVLDVHADWLDALRRDRPELSCQAVADRLAAEKGLRVHETTLWYWLHRRGVTHKKELDRRGARARRRRSRPLALAPRPEDDRSDPARVHR